MNIQGASKCLSQFATVTDEPAAMLAAAKINWNAGITHKKWVSSWDEFPPPKEKDMCETSIATKLANTPTAANTPPRINHGPPASPTEAELHRASNTKIAGYQVLAIAATLRMRKGTRRGGGMGGISRKSPR